MLAITQTLALYRGKIKKPNLAVGVAVGFAMQYPHPANNDPFFRGTLMEIIPQLTESMPVKDLEVIASFLEKLANRMSFAIRTLRETDDLISGIAYSCGFNTICYFNKIFKRLKGLSPAKYREMLPDKF